MKKLRIILVEDEPLISIYFAELLEEMGNEVSAIETTESAAVAAAARLKPDLMIVDVHLIEGNGIAAVARILKDGFVPHIFTTGDRLVKGEVGPDAIILQKPFLDSALTKAIEAALLAKAAHG
ncbi:response regulator [Rhizobium sp. PL01]|uniref:response regulator n=1 Tax=Rhizobium sp. PL01 TaxID=3085631 RepID=UPI0029814256|nr:response regulator [Rhizobium sp. PL01]MDW5317499.1 response regulator [Rhizobium sp. PL01]